MRERVIRRFPVQGVLVALGTTALVVLVGLALATSDAGPLVPSVLPALFLVAGTTGGRARPDHRGLQALTAVGSLHLAAFAVTVWLRSSGPLEGWGPWLTAGAADALFLGGFAALALVIGCYPEGRVRTGWQRALRALTVVALATGLIADALLHPGLELVLASPTRSVPAPDGLTVGSFGVDGVVLLLACVLASVPVLVLSASSLPAPGRQALGWAKLAGSAVSLMLLATPFGSTLLPGHAWDLVFTVVVGCVPFVLLAGLVRYRLLQVDLYLVRTLAGGVLVLLVLAAYAALAAAGRGFTAAGVVVTLVAAITGQSVLRAMESLADRWFAGGRLAQGAVLGELDRRMSTTPVDALPEHVRRTLEQGLDVAWVRLVGGDRVIEGDPDTGEAAVSAEMLAAGEVVGHIECGLRRGGWGAREMALLRRAAATVAPAIRQMELTHELAGRVAELAASRNRLVQAEEGVRRRIERDLHDGVQQQLVALLAGLSVARARLTPGSTAIEAVDDAQDLARRALEDLRHLVLGIHPPLLGDHGLAAAVAARVAPLPLEVEVDVDPRISDHRFEPEVEGAAYFLVSEALTNAMKHSGAARARVVIAPLDEGGIRVAVTDTGNGAASFAGSGLRGLRDRVEALGGHFAIQTTQGVGTTVVGEFVTDRVPSRA